MFKIPCTVEILTLNSALTLPRVLESVKDFAEILVLDGGSTDGTKNIATSFGARVMEQNNVQKSNTLIEDFSAVRNIGLEAASYPWFLFIDSDEYLSEEAIAEISEILKQPDSQCGAYEVKRKYIMDGQVIDYSITYPAIQTRFFNRDAVTKFIKPVHERINVRPEVKICRLENPIYVPQENKFFPQKWFRYLEIEAVKYKKFSIFKCLLITTRRSAMVFLYAWRYFLLLFLNKKPRAPWRHEMSYIVYNFVHIYKMWCSRLRL